MHPRSLLTGLLAILPAVTWGQPEPPSGCFCLRDVGTDQVLYRACIGFKPVGQYYGKARCTTEQGEVGKEILMTEDYAVIGDGESGCHPCQPGPRGGRDVPRTEP